MYVGSNDGSQIGKQYEHTQVRPSEEQLRFKDEDRGQVEEAEISFFSKITNCFSGCCGENSEAEFNEDLEPNFITLAARRWWNPKPYDRDTEDGEWVKGAHILLAGLIVLNTVAKVIFTLISFVPGSSSEFVCDNIIDVDEWANKGLADNTDCETKDILPLLFTAIAVAVNPFAEMNSDVNKINCLADRVFEEAVMHARAGMQYSRFNDAQYTNESGIKEMLQRNVVSRFLFLTATVMVVVEKIVYLAVGVILTACAAVTLFRNKNLNDMARSYLGALDVIDDVCVGLRAMLYPWQNLGADVNLSRFRSL